METREQLERESVERGRDLGRVIGFSDGVFAIAITLLVLGIDIPRIPEGQAADRLPRAIADLAPKMLSYAIGFAVIALFWSAHHRLFRDLVAVDGRLVALNLVYLGVIAFMPFPTSLLGRYESVSTAVVLYAATVAAAGALSLAMSTVALRGGFVRPSRLDDFRRNRLRAIDTVVVFLLSIPIALVAPTYAPYTWLLLIATGRILARRAQRG